VRQELRRERVPVENRCLVTRERAAGRLESAVVVLDPRSQNAKLRVLAQVLGSRGKTGVQQHAIGVQERDDVAIRQSADAGVRTGRETQVPVLRDDLHLGEALADRTRCAIRGRVVDDDDVRQRPRQLAADGFEAADREVPALVCHDDDPQAHAEISQ
jgi:hypothetical protein